MPTKESTTVLDPQKTVALLSIKNGDYVADFGSGHGYFTIPLARYAAPNGKVFAVDIQRSMLDVVRAKSTLEHILNIEYIWSDLESPEGSKLKNEFVDLVVITNILHQSSRKEEIIREAQRILRPGGRLVLIEWEDGAMSGFGPPTDMRIPQETARTLCRAQSLTLLQEFDAGGHHYGLIFTKHGETQNATEK